MSDGPALILLHGGAGTGEAEGMVARGRLAAAGVSARAARSGRLRDALSWRRTMSAVEGRRLLLRPVDRDAPGEAFSLRKRVVGLAEKLEAKAVAVMGAGALPFLAAEDFAAVLEGLAGGGNVAVTNNFYSSDLTAWTPSDAIARVGPFERDNVLPRRLRDEAGCAVTVLPRTVRTAFDLDTPADLVVLALSEATPEAIREALPAGGGPFRWRPTGR